METLEQIADKVGRETDEYLSDKIAAPEEWKRIRDIEFSRRLVAELAKQEPVAFIHTFESGEALSWFGESSNYTGRPDFVKSTPLYAAPIPTPEDVRDAERYRAKRKRDFDMSEAKNEANFNKGYDQICDCLAEAAMTAAQEGK